MIQEINDIIDNLDKISIASSNITKVLKYIIEKSEEENKKSAAWINQGWHDFYCSNCKNKSKTAYNYCPNCGASMTE